VQISSGHASVYIPAMLPFANIPDFCISPRAATSGTDTLLKDVTSDSSTCPPVTLFYVVYLMGSIAAKPGWPFYRELLR